MPLTISVLETAFAVSRLESESRIPSWAADEELIFVAKADGGISIVCRQDILPSGIRSERGWRCLKIEGPFGFDEVGILLSALKPLAEAEVPVLAFSTFDTDYIIVKERDLRKAIGALEGHGHRVVFQD